MILMLPNIYKGDYRLLALVPLALIVLSLFFIPSIKMGVDFQGGTLVTLSVNGSVDAEELQAQLQQEGLDAKVQAFDTTIGSRVEVEVPQSDDLVDAEQLKDDFSALVPEVSHLEVLAYQNLSYQAEYEAKKKALENISDQMFTLAEMDRSQMNISGTNELQAQFSLAYTEVYRLYQKRIAEPIDKHVEYDSISVQTVSPVLSKHFMSKVIDVVIFSALLSVILVFLFFRAVAPSVAVLTGAFSDIVIALGVMGLLGIPLTLPSFAALMMLIGYSLDTDILLTTRILRRKGDPRENAFDAMKTGLTMSVTGIIAFGALFMLAVLTHIPTYYEISAVALAGLVGDMFATWGINAVMILHYAEKRRDA